MSIEKLLKQKTEIEAQIAKANLIEKNKAKVEKVVLKLLQKRPEFFLADPKVFEKNLGDSFDELSKKLTDRQQ